MDRKGLCDENCNACVLLQDSNGRILTRIFNELQANIGNEVYNIVQSYCPNLTVCHNCRIDDFCHDEDCPIVPEGSSIDKTPEKIFNPFEQVFIMKNNKICQMFVFATTTFFKGTKLKIKYSLVHHIADIDESYEGIDYSKEFVFATKQDLLDSL